MEPTGAQTNRREMLFVHIIPARHAASADSRLPSADPSRHSNDAPTALVTTDFGCQFGGADIEIATGDRR